LALLRIQRRQQRLRELVRPLVQRRALAPAGGGQARYSDPLITTASRHLHQPGSLERAQEPAHVPGVEAQAGTQNTHLAALGPDLPQQPSLAEGPGPAEEAMVERPDALGHNAVEASDLTDHHIRHSLTLVSKLRGVKS